MKRSLMVIVAAVSITMVIVGCGSGNHTSVEGAVIGKTPFTTNDGLAIVSFYGKGPHQSQRQREEHSNEPRPIGEGVLKSV